MPSNAGALIRVLGARILKLCGVKGYRTRAQTLGPRVSQFSALDRNKYYSSQSRELTSPDGLGRGWSYSSQETRISEVVWLFSGTFQQPGSTVSPVQLFTFVITPALHWSRPTLPETLQEPPCCYCPANFTSVTVTRSIESTNKDKKQVRKNKNKNTWKKLSSGLVL